MKVFLCFDGDSISHRVSLARMADDAIEIARISQLINKGNDIFKSFAIENGGQVIQIGGDEGAIQIDAKCLELLEKIRDKYESVTNATVSVGIGKTISEAFKALIAAKLRGKNRSVLFDDDVNKEIAEAQKEESEQKKIVEEYLGKANDQKRMDIPRQFRSGNAGANTTARSYKHEFAQKTDYGHGLAIRREQSKPKLEHSKAKQTFTKIADTNEQKDRAINSKKTSNLEEIKQKIGSALAAMHQQLPVLQQIKQGSPETYAAIVGLINGLVALGRQVQTVDKELEKALSKSNVPIPKSIPGVQGMLDEGEATYDLGMDKADLLPGGQADNKNPQDFDPEALAIGTQHEMEHTADEALAREIAMDHLAEDPDYYKKQLPELLKDGIDEINSMGTEPIAQQELDPNLPIEPKNVLSKDQLPTTIKPLKSTKHLIPGQVTAPRHIVATVKGKPIVRAVGSGMKRDQDTLSPNPIGPGMGNPVSAKKKLSQ